MVLAPASGDRETDLAAFRENTDRAAIFLGTVAGLITMVLLMAVSQRDWSCFKWQLAISILVAMAACLTVPALGLLAHGDLHPDWGDFRAAFMVGIGSLLLGLGGRSLHQQQILINTARCPLRNAAAGFLKVRGRAVAASGPAATKVGGLPALYFSEQTQELHRREVHYYDQKTKRKRKRIVYEWKTISRRRCGVPSVVDDGTGHAVVDLGEADTNPAEVALYYNGKRVNGWPYRCRVGDRRTRIDYVSPGATLSVWGSLSRRAATGDGAIGKDPVSGVFVVAQGPEARVFLKYGGVGWAMGLAGVTALAAAVMIIVSNGGVSLFF